MEQKTELDVFKQRDQKKALLVHGKTGNTPAAKKSLLDDYE